MRQVLLILLFAPVLLAQNKVDLQHQVTGTLPAANGGTGVSNTATLTLGSSNQNWATLGTGIVKNTTTTGALSNATFSDVVGLWSSCSGTQYLGFDGNCHTAGAGTVTSFSAGALSPLFTTSVATATTTPALTFSLSNAAAFTLFGNNTSGSAAPSYTTMDSIFGSCSTASSALTFSTSTHLFGCNTLGTGTVTSVSFTGGLISVATPTTTPAFTVVGTSGGIPYFSAASTWASSALLSANNPVLGGGSGTAPFSGSRSGNTTTFGTTSGTLTNGDLATFDASGNIVDGGSKIPAASNNCIPGATASIKALPMGSGLASTGTGWNVWWGARLAASATFQLQPATVSGCIAYPGVNLRIPSSQQGSFYNFRLSSNFSAPAASQDSQIGPGPFDSNTVKQDTWGRVHVNAYTAIPQIAVTAAGTSNSPNYFCCSAGWFPDDLITGIYGNDSDGNWSLGSAAAQFAGFGGRSAAASNTSEALVKIVMPDSYTASNLALMTNTTINVTVTLRQDPWNGSTNTGSTSTALTATQSTNNGGLYIDSTHTVTGVQRDALDLQYTQTAVGPTNFQFYTTLGIALSTQGYGMLIWLMDETGTVSATRFYSPFAESGHLDSSTTEGDVQYASPDAYTIDNCFTWLNQAPTNATVISLSVNGSTSGTPTLSTSGATGSLALSGSTSVSRKDKITMKVVYPSTGTQPKISSITCRTH